MSISVTFFDDKLSPATISAYRSALAKLLRLIFGIDISQQPSGDFRRALFNIRPSRPSFKIHGSLNRVLKLALFRRFQSSPTVENLHMLTLFLIALATGNRISEIGALLRAPEFASFSEERVCLSPNLVS